MERFYGFGEQRTEKHKEGLRNIRGEGWVVGSKKKRIIKKN
jgi:hypothetical protein